MPYVEGWKIVFAAAVAFKNNTAIRYKNLDYFIEEKKPVK